MYLKTLKLSHCKMYLLGHTGSINTEYISCCMTTFFSSFFFYNSFVIKDREYMYIAAKANTRHDPIYKIK